jgi:hypothetical protein
MKKFRYIMSGILVFLCLLGSCSGGADLGGNKPLEEEGIEEKIKDPDNEKEGKEDETDDTEDTSEEIPPPAVFLRYKTLPGDEIVFEFSDSVSFVSLNFEKEHGYGVIEKEGSEIIIKLTGDLAPGLLVVADLKVEDEHENIISEQISFRTRNNRVPRLQINELRTEFKNLQAEFIEFKMLSDGNLGAVRVFVASNDKTPQIYEFEPIEVKESDYVVLHLRTLEESCRNEYKENLGDSGGTDSCPTARDLWIPGSDEMLRKTDAVYVLDQDDKALDAVMFAVDTNAWAKKDYFPETAELLFKKDVWKSSSGTVCSVADVVSSSGIGSAMTRSISRKEGVNTNTAADWYVTANNGATPGLPNKL